MKKAKGIIVCIGVVIGIILMAISVLHLYNESVEYYQRKTFLAKYEFEDFSQFKNVSVFIRGGDIERNPIIFVNAPHLVRNTSKVGYYVVILDKKNYQVIEAKWTVGHDVDADTLKLQQLAKSFMQYEIPRLEVDEQGNVSVYLENVETLALVRFANEKELQKRNKEGKWFNVKPNWYKLRPVLKFNFPLIFGQDSEPA